METNPSNSDVQSESFDENNTNENDKATLEVKGQEPKEDEKTDTALKNDSPHSPLSPDLQGEPLNSGAQNEKRYELPQYKSPDLVLKNLKKWGFEVIEYQKVEMSKDEWKARINGVFESFPKDKQQYLEKMFDVRFRGSFSSPHVWISFKVEALP